MRIKLYDIHDPTQMYIICGDCDGEINFEMGLEDEDGAMLLEIFTCDNCLRA